MKLYALGLLSLCMMVGCREASEKVVEKSVQAAKETAKGIEEGVEKGRKAGESADGALLVANMPELQGKGSIAVLGKRSLGEAGTGAEVDVALENATDRPLRFLNIEVLGLDKEGFVVRPAAAGRTEVTVPAKAKEKLTVRFEAAADKLAKVRIWQTDLDVPHAKK